MGGELHRADLAVEKELVGGGHGGTDFRRRRVVEAGGELELEGAGSVGGGIGGGGSQYGRGGPRRSGGEDVVHGACRSAVEESDSGGVVEGAAGAGGGAHEWGGAVAVVAVVGVVVAALEGRLRQRRQTLVGRGVISGVWGFEVGFHGFL